MEWRCYPQSSPRGQESVYHNNGGWQTARVYSEEGDILLRSSDHPVQQYYSQCRCGRCRCRAPPPRGPPQRSSWPPPRAWPSTATTPPPGSGSSPPPHPLAPQHAPSVVSGKGSRTSSPSKHGCRLKKHYPRQYKYRILLKTTKNNR